MGCHGPEGHDGKEPRHEKKERLTTSSGGDHDRHLAEKLRVEASPKTAATRFQLEISPAQERVKAALRGEP